MVESSEAGALTSDPVELQAIIEAVEEEIEKLQTFISEEDAKNNRYLTVIISIPSKPLFILFS